MLSQAKSKPKRRRRRKSPGVSLLQPQTGSRVGWRIQFKDPDHGDKIVRKAVPAEWSTTPELRASYCVKRSDELAARRRELAGGATRKSGTSIELAAKQWLETYPEPRTRETYGEAVNAFARWCGDHGIQSFDDVTKGALKSFRDDIYTDDLAATTLNRRLRSLRTFLAWSIEKEYCPLLHADHLSALKKWREEIELRPYLDPSDVQKVFEAVERHDSDVFRLTRQEKVGGRRRHRGETSKYDSLTPLLVLISLTGLRLKEAVRLTWDHFDSDKLDASGRPIGELYVPANIAKTKQARRIPLDHSPALRGFLIQRKLETGGEGTIAGVSYDQAAKGLKRIRAVYGCPSAFSWQALRRTVSTYLTSAPHIFGSASHAQAATRLGHSWKIAQAHYADAVAGIAKDARTLEAALQIEENVSRACADSQPSGTRRSSTALSIARA